MRFFSYDFLVSKGVPEQNFVAALTQARDLLRNPFCSIVKPTQNLRDYADLAFLCTDIKKNLLLDRVFTNYRGQAELMCTLSVAELRQMATFMHEISLEKAGSDASYASLYRKALAEGAATITDVNGQVFRSDVENADGEEEPVVGAEEAAIRAEQLRERIRLSRAGWPRQAMMLPPNTRRVSADEMFDTIVGAFTDKGKAFIVIMEHLFAAQSQVPLGRMPPNAVNYPSPIKALAQEVIVALGHWGIEVPHW